NGRFADWQFAAFARLLDSLARRSESLTKKVSQSKILEAEKLLAAVDRLYTAARKVAADPEATVDSRVEALRLVGRGEQSPSDIDLLNSFLSPQAAPELQNAAIQALGRTRNDRVPALLIEAWRGFGPARRSQVLDLLTSRDA